MSAETDGRYLWGAVGFGLSLIQGCTNAIIAYRKYKINKTSNQMAFLCIANVMASLYFALGGFIFFFGTPYVPSDYRKWLDQWSAVFWTLFIMFFLLSLVSINKVILQRVDVLVGVSEGWKRFWRGFNGTLFSLAFTLNIIMGVSSHSNESTLYGLYALCLAGYSMFAILAGLIVNYRVTWTLAETRRQIAALMSMVNVRDMQRAAHVTYICMFGSFASDCIAFTFFLGTFLLVLPDYMSAVWVIALGTHFTMETVHAPWMRPLSTVVYAMVSPIDTSVGLPIQFSRLSQRVPTLQQTTHARPRVSSGCCQSHAHASCRSSRPRRHQARPDAPAGCHGDRNGPSGHS